MRTRRCLQGFTLVELLLAIAVMALMTVLGWRGLDGMARAQDHIQQHSNQLLTLQTGLAQWVTDLDAMVSGPQVNSLDWDGRVLRLTRRNSAPDAEGLLVVAWSLRSLEGTDQWLRWQSPPLQSRLALQQAWQRASLWGQNPGDQEKKWEVPIGPVTQWQLYYFRGDSWSNPLSSADSAAEPSNSSVSVPLVGSSIPEGVRLVLTLPTGSALSGTLTRDWVRPNIGGGKS